MNALARERYWGSIEEWNFLVTGLQNADRGMHLETMQN